MTYSSEDSLPPIEAIQAVMVASKTGSFTAAAVELDVTHATISRRIEIAENWFRIRLFERHARGVTVTAEGQLILAKVSQALEQLKQARQSRPKGLSLPVVKLATTPSLARFWLLSRLTELEGTEADLRVELITSPLNTSLLTGEVDLAIRYGRGGWGDGDEEQLFEESLCPVVSVEVAEKLAELTPQDLPSIPLIHTGDTTLWRAWMTAHGVHSKPKPSDRIFGDYAQAIEAARSGLGIALWNPAIHSLDEFNGQLVALNEMTCRSPLSFFLLSKSGPAHTPPMRVRSRLRALLGRPD